jgi:hypothetical protein
VFDSLYVRTDLLVPMPADRVCEQSPEFAFFGLFQSLSLPTPVFFVLSFPFPPVMSDSPLPLSYCGLDQPDDKPIENVLHSLLLAIRPYTTPDFPGMGRNLERHLT